MVWAIWPSAMGWSHVFVRCAAMGRKETGGASNGECGSSERRTMVEMVVYGVNQ